MSRIRTHIPRNLVPVAQDVGAPEDYRIEPGTFVRLRSEKDTFGTCVSRQWEKEPEGSRFQVEKCDVLWTKPPNIPEIDIKVQSIPITSSPRKLKVTWTVDSHPTYVGTVKKLLETSPAEHARMDEWLIDRLKRGEIEPKDIYNLDPDVKGYHIEIDQVRGITYKFDRG